MNNLKTTKVNLIRSRALTALFSIILSALILLPFITSAKGKKKTEVKETVYMKALQQNALAAVTISNIDADKYVLSVESRDGSNVYFNKYYSNLESFSKIFDFSRLEDGAYTFKAIKGSSTSERHFVITDGKIEVDYNKSVRPLFTSTGVKAQIEFEEKLDSDVTVTVYSPTGETLYIETLEKDSKRKQFDFSKVGEGSYKLVVTANDEEFAFNYQK